MLIIDDEIKLLTGLKAVMARAGYEVLIAHEANEGLKLAKEHLPDMIICDVMMPVVNGFQLKSILEKDEVTSTIPFIFLTGRSNQDDKLFGLKQGADDYITKPFNVDELLARVQAILRRKKNSSPINEISAIQQDLTRKNAELEQLYYEVKTQSITDPLTDLYNRRGFCQIGEQEIKHALRYERPLSAIMLDIDHFKKVNDTYGYAVGDLVLIEIAKRCGQEVRKVDVFGRYGGEEFSAILPETPLVGAYQVAERLRAAVSEPMFVGQSRLNVTISLGVAMLTNTLGNLEELLRLADLALDKAKASGRNCTCMIRD